MYTTGSEVKIIYFVNRLNINDLLKNISLCKIVVVIKTDFYFYFLDELPGD